ncbi:alpha/beta fold hydrolase [Sphaerisporangium aureirubrum]|uniref:Alpha/beta fold hydrolase n=1 Tax=Sphaerisporangium aureirubrum TaxID=1544736 RepID=A0ABW1NU18_9ACTN
MLIRAHVNGIGLAYWMEGTTGSPLVLLHGRTATHADWGDSIARFAARHRVFAVDLRGHGASEYAGDYRFPVMAEDVRALLDHLKLDRASVVGHSLGGVVAYHLAMTHPHRLDRMVLEDPPPPFPMTRPPVQEDDSKGFDWQMVHQTESQFTTPDPTWRDSLKQITTPTLILSGGPKSHVRPEPLATLIPTAHLQTLDTGHLIHTTDPNGFHTAVDPFLHP